MAQWNFCLLDAWRSSNMPVYLKGRICSDNFTCCRTEIEFADQNVHLTQSQYTDTGPTSSCTDPITPGAWQGSHWSAISYFTRTTRPRKIAAQRDSNPGSSALEGDALTTRPTRRCTVERRSHRELEIRGSIRSFPIVIAWTETLVLKWLPCRYSLAV